MDDEDLIGTLELEDESEPPPRELGLAVAVVKKAVYDVRTGVRDRRDYESASAYTMLTKSAEDASDFLLIRLNEDGNCWGDLLREYGMRPLTEARLALLIQGKITVNGREE